MFINGLYWGQYNLHERPDEDFSASYYGGDPEDYDVIKHNNDATMPDDPQVVSGSLDAWNTALAMANAGLASAQAYQDIQQYIDVPNLIDYMIANLYVGNDDWPYKNWYFSRNRVSGEGFRFHSWDAERTMRDVSVNRTGVGAPGWLP